MRELHVEAAAEAVVEVADYVRASGGVPADASLEDGVRWAMKRRARRFSEELAEMVQAGVIDLGLDRTLVAYHGGGYDGCMWEWNYAFYDAHRRFYPILATGRSGASDREEMIVEGHLIDSHTTFYDLACPEDQKDLARSEPVDFLIHIARWFHDDAPHEMSEEDGANLSVGFFCDECDEFHDDATYARGVHPSGDGGIHISNDDIVCDECYAAGMCDCCSEYVGKENLVRVGDEVLCRWTVEENIRNLTDKAEKLEEELDKLQ